MESSGTKRTRSERVASLQLEPSTFSRIAATVFTGKNILQLLIALIAAGLLLVILRGWEPPFAFREGQIPERDIIARVQFEIQDTAQTDALRAQKRRDVACYYENNPSPIQNLHDSLRRNLELLSDDEPFDKLSDRQSTALSAFTANKLQQEQDLSDEEALNRIRGLLAQHGILEGGKVDSAIKAILDPLRETGVLDKLQHGEDEGSRRSIIVVPDLFVDVPKVRRASIVAELPQQVSERFQQTFADPDAQLAAKLIAGFLVAELPQSTLTYRRDLSEEARRKADDSVDDVFVSYSPTISRLADAGVPLSRNKEIPVLRAEYNEWIKTLSWPETSFRFLAFVGMLGAMFVLCGLFIYFQYDSKLISDPRELLKLLGTVVLTCLLCRFTALDPARAEVVPIVLCSLTLTLAFGSEVAMLVTACLTLVITLGLGLNLGELVTLFSGICAVALFLGRIRTRTKLIYVGLAAGCIVALTHLGVQTVLGNLHAISPEGVTIEATVTNWRSLWPGLVEESVRMGGYTLLASALMTGLLPFVERAFGVQTDLSLLELGDASHPLLRQLAQRAPGTYNHSINVAAIAEAAADSIGAHGLLTRVGAYFHDIGKMFKPNYFIENQEQGGNKHDTLQPAMSTLVIIAHVKDGADLGRQHRLPKRLIDFIEQHHGTTLVEYFYREAEKRSLEDPNKEEVSETSFRYPGPKPQTLEAAVLMLADSVESASRTLVEPTSSRIQSLVDQIAMKKLLDGQFDQCGLTLQQLDKLKSSLVKSLNAIYHGRVKYSGQASA